MLTNEEFKIVKEFIEQKAIGLMRHEGKNSTAVRFPKSNYTYFPFANRNFYSVATNTFIEIINNDLLRKATKKFPTKFGTGNAFDVIEAIYFSTQNYLPEIYDNYKNRLNCFSNFLLKAHCYIIENSNGLLNSKNLRLDLFRVIDKNNVDENKYDFTGGLFHSFKHFSINEINLSVGKENNVEIYHPIKIIVYTIEAFFYSQLEKLSEENTYSSVIRFNDLYNLKFIFYHQSDTQVYFIKTIRKDKITFN